MNLDLYLKILQVMGLVGNYSEVWWLKRESIDSGISGSSPHYGLAECITKPFLLSGSPYPYLQELQVKLLSNLRACIPKNTDLEVKSYHFG